MKTRVCRDCGVPKEESDENFGRAVVIRGSKTWRYFRSICRSCEVERTRKYRTTDAGKEMRNKERKRRFQINLGLYQAVKEQQKCCMCPESDPACIDFHHLVPRKKRRALVVLIRASFTRVVAEMAKCVCLCANCHRKFHAGRLPLPADLQPLSVEFLTACLNKAKAAVSTQ